MAGRVRLLEVSKRYRARGPWVLRDIDAELAPGQLIRVTGPNGCGKSTLLRLVCGASAPSRGRIDGRPRPGRAGYVPERFPSALPFTAQGYLTRLGRVQGLRGARLDDAVTATIERLGLGPYARLPLGVTCLLAGSAIGALCNPPLIRHRAYAVISTAAVAIAALAASGSPANAAIRATSATPAHHLPWVPVLIAVIVAALAWTASVVAAPRRAG